LLSTQLINISVIQIATGDYRWNVALAADRMWSTYGQAGTLPTSWSSNPPHADALAPYRPARSRACVGSPSGRGRTFTLADRAAAFDPRLLGLLVMVRVLASMPNLMNSYDAYPEKDVRHIAVMMAQSPHDQMDKQTRDGQEEQLGRP